MYDTRNLLGIGSFPLAGCTTGAGGWRGDPVYEAVGGGDAVSVVVWAGGDIHGWHGGHFPL
jgi:hypothetical protein